MRDPIAVSGGKGMIPVVERAMLFSNEDREYIYCSTHEIEIIGTDRLIVKSWNVNTYLNTNLE
jgi:hypothetical protein